jgi:hypothetical protein
MLKKVAAERHLPQLFFTSKVPQLFFLANFFIAYIVRYRVHTTPIQVGSAQLQEMRSGLTVRDDRRELPILGI